jgi:hypothetical protein
MVSWGRLLWEAMFEKIRDTQCAELNRQEIGGESPLPGKV